MTADQLVAAYLSTGATTTTLADAWRMAEELRRAREKELDTLLFGRALTVTEVSL